MTLKIDDSYIYPSGFVNHKCQVHQRRLTL